LLDRHRDARLLVPPGRCTLQEGAQFETPGLTISKAPITDIDVKVREIAVGNRSQVFGNSLGSVGDRGETNLPLEASSKIAAEFGGRLLADDEREYIDAGGFESVSECSRYGVEGNFYGFSPDEEYAYVAWDAAAGDKPLCDALESEGERIQERRDQVRENAWRTGRVWNPRRILIEAGLIGGGYSVQYSPGSPSTIVTLEGGVVGRGSLLIGYRYSINGSEMDGEGYGFVGIQGSMMKSFDLDVPEFNRESIDFSGSQVKVRQKMIEGWDLALVFTLGHALYIGAGMGHGKLTARPAQAGVSIEEVKELNYYVFPAGILIRLGTNSALNFGGVALWHESFKRVAFFAGVGLTLDIPFIRTGA